MIRIFGVSKWNIIAHVWVTITEPLPKMENSPSLPIDIPSKPPIDEIGLKLSDLDDITMSFPRLPPS